MTTLTGDGCAQPSLFESNASLKNKNTLAVDSVASQYCACTNLSDLKTAIRTANEQSLEIKVLGGGSNVVMAPEIQGLVLQYKNSDIQVLKETDSEVIVRVGAGYNWHTFVMDALHKGWYGLENLALIPGTVGAAPVQNIGAYGVEVEQFIVRVNGLWLDDAQPFTLSKKACAFEYRESCFKQKLDQKTIITSVDFCLPKQANVNVRYAPLNKMAEEKGIPDPLTLANWVISVRQSKLPDPSVLPNAGSFFKNPVVSQDKYERLVAIHQGMPSYPQAKGVKLAAGWLIDQLGLKGASLGGGISINEKQALVLINQGGSGEDVQRAARIVQQKVFEEYGIELEQEPRLFR